MSLWICFLQSYGPPMMERHPVDWMKDVSLLFRNSAAQHVELFFPQKNQAFTSLITATGKFVRHPSYYCKFNEEHSWSVFEMKLPLAEYNKIYEFCDSDHNSHAAADGGRRYDYLSLFTFGYFNSARNGKYTCASYVAEALLQSEVLKKRLKKFIGVQGIQRLAAAHDPHQIFEYVNICCIRRCKYLLKLNFVLTYTKCADGPFTIDASGSFFNYSGGSGTAEEV